MIVAAARGKVRINSREVSDFEARLRPIAGTDPLEGVFRAA